MQEAALSQNCQVVCDGKSLEWSAIQTFFATVEKLQFKPFFSIPHIGIYGGLEIARTPVTLEGWRVAVRKCKLWDIRGLFVLTESRDCKEAVDRIWAILALFPIDLQQRVREAGIIDYSASGKKQYWKTYLSFLKLLYLDSPIDLWKVIYYGQGLAKNPNLPSWCPDFNATRQCNKYFYIGEFCRAGFPDAESSINPTLLLSPESTFLMVKGFTFDTVQSIKQNILPLTTKPKPYDEVSEDERKAFRDWLQETFRLFRETLGLSEEAVMTLCQTLLGANQVPVSTNAWYQEHEKFVLSVGVAYYYEAGAFGLSHLGDEVPESITSKYDEAVENIRTGIDTVDSSGFLGRTFITTTQRRIGFGTADMRNGDMVCIVEGADPVFVLRRVDHDTLLSSGIHSPEDLDQHPELFRLVGDAYIHGCMYGEAFTASDRGPDREFTLA